MKRRIVSGVASVQLVAALCVGVALAQLASVKLQWTAPGDDGTVGVAAAYDGVYGTTRPDTTSLAAFVTWCNAQRKIPGMPVPRPAGQIDSVRITPPGGLSPDSTYYFVIRTRDEVPNWSAPSNVAWVKPPDTTPPAPISSVKIVP